MVIVAFAVQPGGAQGQTQPTDPTLSPEDTTTPTVAATPTAAQPTQTAAPTQTVAASVTASASGTAESDVAGARSTPSPTATEGVDLSHQQTQCGSLQESSVALSVEQAINGVSVRAQRAAVYPIEYFRCILMATGTTESFSLASAVSKAQTSDMTNIALIDLWVTNTGRDYGQLSMQNASLAAAGQTFTPLATLGGRGDIVVASGTGRSVSLVVAIKNTVGATTGPMTLTLPAPMFGGTQMAGKYQLFLPTP